MTTSTITTAPLERGQTWQEALTFATTTPSDNSEHVRTIYDLAVAMRPKTVVEIGVGFGWFTTALLAALENTGGRLVSVDNVDYPETRCSLACPWWEYIVADADQFAKSWQGQIDLLVLDHSHVHPTHATYPWGLLSRWMPVGGATVAHSTTSHPEIGAAMRECAGDDWDIEERRNNCGLMILWRKARVAAHHPDNINPAGQWTESMEGLPKSPVADGPCA